MNGSKSPDRATKSVGGGDEGARPTTNGHRSPAEPAAEKSKSPMPSIEGRAGVDDEELLPDAPAAQAENITKPSAAGGDDDAASEAETLISSPVKRREAEKQQKVPPVRTEKPLRSRIGGLPVPGDDDEDGDSTASPMQSTEISVSKATSSGGDGKDDDVDMLDEDSDKDAENEDDDEIGSELSSAHSPSNPASRASSRSRALSQGPETTTSSTRNGTNSPNPRKRKHRASSVGLPSSKRQSMDPPTVARRKLRGMHSEDNAGGEVERSASPKMRGHRRAVSTQSALDGTAEAGSRKRRANTHTFPPARGGAEPKSATRATYEESDASSETTSRGLDEHSRRPQRGVVRSTSTPGRPGPGREHKRHVNRYGFTRLAEACEDGDMDAIKEWIKKDPEQLEIPEFAGNKPLQIAALNGNAEVVAYLIEQGCQIDSANTDKDTPLIDAAENGHLEVVELLLDAGVDPLRQNLKGQQALDVVTQDPDDKPAADAIRAALVKAIDAWNSSEARQRREEEEELRHNQAPSKELHLMARTPENLMRLVVNNDRNGVQEFLRAGVQFDNTIVAAAAKTGDLYLVNMLLADMLPKKAMQKPEKPMLAVLGTGHFEMAKALTELEYFPPLWKDRQGRTWAEIAEERQGPNWRQEKEILLKLYEQANSRAAGGIEAKKERRSSSPVSKRSGESSASKRSRQQQQARAASLEEESEDEGPAAAKTKRKNGRRLMSRKDMRAASSNKGGKDAAHSASDDEDDGSTSDTAAAASARNETPATANDEAMKPPDTPTTRRAAATAAAGRLRSASHSSGSSQQQQQQPRISPDAVSPKSLRKRAGSVRDGKGANGGLAAVKEEEKDADDTVEVASPAADKDKVKKEKEDEAKRKAEEAKVAAEAEAKRLEEEAAKRKAQEEEEARKAAEAEAERKKEEEEQERRRKQEQEEAEEKARVEEEARKKAEDERLQREKELEEKKQSYRADVLDALPNGLKQALEVAVEDQSSATAGARSARNRVLEQFTPLKVLVDSKPSPNSHEKDYWVLNFQAAALLGNDEARKGLELFFKAEDCPYFEETLASRWNCAGMTLPRDRVLVEQLLADMFTNIDEPDDDMDTERTFQQDLDHMAERGQAFATARRNLLQQGSKALLRRVRLEDVMGALPPTLLQGTSSGGIEVEFLPGSEDHLPNANGMDVDSGNTSDNATFVEKLQAQFERQVAPVKVSSMEDVMSASNSKAEKVVEFTDVRIVHQK